jgi:plasmid maintenance system antidote protein VapI
LSPKAKKSEGTTLTVGQELLTRLQKQHNGCSLYSVAQILCISHQNVYQIAKGNRHMATDTLLIACDCLGEDARPWLIRAEMDTCKSPQRRQILQKILTDLEGPVTRAVAGVLAFFMVGFYGMF